MVPIGGGSTKSVLSDRWIVYTKSRKQLLHRKYLLYDTGCMYLLQAVGSKMPRYRLFGDSVKYSTLLNSTGERKY